MSFKTYPKIRTRRGSDWSAEEIGILKSLYPALGAAGVRERLPKRTIASIRTRAYKIKVVCDKRLLPLTPHIVKLQESLSGRVAIRAGYRWIKNYTHPNRLTENWVPEHVLVAEKKIGRFLIKGEHVHHINLDTLDNSADNLIVLRGSEHTRLHRQLDSLAKVFLREGKIIYDGEKYVISSLS